MALKKIPVTYVVGAQGWIGRNLYRAYQALGVSAGGSGVHPDDNNDDNHLDRLDLRDSRRFDVLRKSRGVQHVLIAAGRSGLAACEQDPEGSRAVNVEGTIALIEAVWRCGAVPVFLSSSAVFSGEPGRPWEEKDRPDPRTMYGRQKREVEKFLSRSRRPWLVLRLDKIFDVRPDNKDMTTQWLRKIRGGGRLIIAVDQVISLTWMEDLVRAVLFLQKNRVQGVVHVSSEMILTRWEWFQELLSLCPGAQPNLVLKTCRDLSRDLGWTLAANTALRANHCLKKGVTWTPWPVCRRLMARTWAEKGEDLSMNKDLVPA